MPRRRSHPVLARLSAELFQTSRQITHVLRTLAPLRPAEYCYLTISVRLACLIHAASVRSEPESNSPIKIASAIFAAGFYTRCGPSSIAQPNFQ